ncbi:hypothetical protein PVK06_048217 [Gossypium arboreum]|uniref:Uncharacterized protein n=1 Tax=Gossypium arboreum TaxID=29729 RepID=A0ABR0MFC7_GOSAR|nr:hypothetical protein PVK06_048217 [Gossypium arboreum]
MTPVDEVVHDVPKTDSKDHCIIVNHPELDCTSQQELEMYSQYDGYLNETSNWINRASTNTWSYDKEYGASGENTRQEPMESMFEGVATITISMALEGLNYSGF